MTRVESLSELLRQSTVLLGCSVESAAPASAELGGIIGFDFLWCDMEHMSTDWSAAEHFCRGAKAGGALPMLRVENAERPSILHALEAGARFVVVPMVESASTARDVVKHGKFPPLGARGFNGSSRGLGYGLGSPQESMQKANQLTDLFVQIETAEGVRKCEEIVAVEGITGGLVGPADLSISFGKPLAFTDTELLSHFREVIRSIHRQGKVAAAVALHPSVLEVCLAEGAQIVVCAGETSSLRVEWKRTLNTVSDKIRLRTPQIGADERDDIVKPLPT